MGTVPRSTPPYTGITLVYFRVERGTVPMFHANHTVGVSEQRIEAMVSVFPEYDPPITTMI